MLLQFFLFFFGRLDRCKSSTRYSYRHFLVCLIQSLDVDKLFREESYKLYFETYFLIYGNMGLLVHFWTVLQTVLLKNKFKLNYYFVPQNF